VGGYATGLVLVGLVCLGWLARVTNLKAREMGFRITASHTEDIASEVQKLLESLKLKPQQFRASMNGPTSIVEFHADTGYRQARANCAEEIESARCCGRGGSV